MIQSILDGFRVGGNKIGLSQCYFSPLKDKDAIWQNVSEKGPFFATTFSRPFKDQSGAWHNGTSFGLNDLETLMNVAFEAKEWVIAHTLKR